MNTSDKSSPKSSGSRSKVFCDPIHDLISFRLPEEQLLVELIDTPAFQRLRRISQLGVTSLVFHGAEHSRFAHSLGVVHLVRRILDALKERHRGQQAWVDKLVRHEPYIAMAALLHDLGHGPFSHLFESALATPGKEQRSHEDWTVEIVTNPASEVYQLLRQHGEDTPARVAAIIGRTYPSRLAIDLISSQLDADRLDYLLRDSFMTGARHGNFDVEWLLRSLRIGERDGRQRLCVDGRRGIQVVEAYVHARHLNHVQVYFHKTGRAFEAQFINLIRLARQLLDEEDGEVIAVTVPPLRKALRCGPTDLHDYLALDDVVVSSAINAWSRLSGSIAREELAGACRAFYYERRPYGFVAINDDANLVAAGAVITRLDEELAAGKSLLRHAVHLDLCASHIYKDVAYRTAQAAGGGHSHEHGHSHLHEHGHGLEHGEVHGHSHAHGKGSGSAEEQMREESIWVQEADRLVPVEEHGGAHVIRALSRVSWQSRRLYFDRRHEARLRSVFADCGLVIDEA